MSVHSDKDMLIYGMLSSPFPPPVGRLARSGEVVGVASMLLDPASWGQLNWQPDKTSTYFYDGPVATPLEGWLNMTVPITDVIVRAQRFTDGLDGDDLRFLLERSLLLQEDIALAHMLNLVAKPEDIMTTAMSAAESVKLCLTAEDKYPEYVKRVRRSRYVLCSPSHYDSIGEALDELDLGLTAVESSVIHDGVVYFLPNYVGRMSRGGREGFDAPTINTLDSRYWKDDFGYGWESLSMSVHWTAKIAICC